MQVIMALIIVIEIFTVEFSKIICEREYRVTLNSQTALLKYDEIMTLIITKIHVSNSLGAKKH